MSLNLVRITHRRCGEYTAYTFTMAPSDWGPDEIRKRVDAAQNAYLVEFARVTDSAQGPPNPGYGFPNYAASPDRLVRDVLDEHTKAKAKFDAWRAEQDQARRTFENLLVDQGFISLWSDESGAVKLDCDWGHRHGQRLSYGTDDLDTMPSPAKLAGVEDDDEWSYR